MWLWRIWKRLLKIAPMEPNNVSSRPLRWPAGSETIRAAVLDAAGDAAVYLVGGVVRDAWLGRSGQDWDIATSGAARRVARRVARTLKGSYYSLDEARDVGRVLLGAGEERVVIDIAALRGAKRDDLESRLRADLAERDFTINAMAVDWRGDESRLLDPLSGARDLEKRQLRLCCEDSLQADPLRALRGARLAAMFQLMMTGETARAIRRAAPQLERVSPERVREEWHKLLRLPNAIVALRVAERLGLLDRLLPWLTAWRDEKAAGGRTGWDLRLDMLEGLQAIHRVIDAGRDVDATANFVLGMLAVQLGGIRARLQASLAAETGGNAALRALAVLLSGLKAAELREWGQRWRYSGAEIQWLRRLSQDGGDYPGCLRAGTHPDLCAHRFWRAFGAAGIEGILLDWAQALARLPQDFDQDSWLFLLDERHKLLTIYFDEYERVVAPPPLVSGDILMAELGLAPGPKVGALLDALREAQVLGEIQDVADALELAREFSDN